MRRYDDPVEVRRGMVSGPGGTQEGPEQFLWRGRLWKVCDVVAHWVETGPWWQSPGVHAVLGSDAGSDLADERADDRTDRTERTERTDRTDRTERRGGSADSRVGTDLLAEREVWRVEAARGACRFPT